ncbi:MAG: hypothetical protein DMD60_05180 [Gemmatimonadetes bacterium]|nr:MAG: hypothetical protein DMD60_05180 [Gemmatimonadota bacterium]
MADEFDVFDVSFQLDDPCAWWETHSPTNPAHQATALTHIRTCPQCQGSFRRANPRIERSLRATGSGTYELRPGDRPLRAPKKKPRRRKKPGTRRR